MKRDKKTIEQLINEALEDWGRDQQWAFLRDIMPLLELYNVDGDDDWLEQEVGGDEENVRTIRLIRSIYLISRIAEFHAGKLLVFQNKFPNLYKKMTKIVEALEDPREVDIIASTNSQ